MAKPSSFAAALCALFCASCSTNGDNSSSQEPSRYRFKTGSYVEAARNETFSICPPDKKTEGIWISEYLVALNAENCVSVQTPDLAGTINVLFMENSGLVDTIQVLVDQSYIQMGDYSHKVWVADSNKIKSDRANNIIYIVTPGNYENRKYSQPLIVDKTMFTMGDAQYYSRIDTSITFPSYILEKYKNEKLEESKLPLVDMENRAWKYANERFKKEGLDTLDSGYRIPSNEEWFFLMRAGASTTYYWGDEGDLRKEEDILKISRYAWVRPNGLKPVAQLLPNAFGLYDMVGIASEVCDGGPESFLMCGMGGRRGLGGVVEPINYKGFRLLRKTPKLHKLEKF